MNYEVNYIARANEWPFVKKHKMILCEQHKDEIVDLVGRDDVKIVVADSNLKCEIHDSQ